MSRASTLRRAVQKTDCLMKMRREKRTKRILLKPTQKILKNLPFFSLFFDFRVTENLLLLMCATL